MNTDSPKPPVAPKPKLPGAVGFRLASPLFRACSSTAKGPKPAVAPKPKVLLDRDPGGPARSAGREPCPLAEEAEGGQEPRRGEEVDVEADPVCVAPPVQGLCSGQEAPPRASQPPGTGEESAMPEDDRMRDSDEEWGLSDAGTGSPVWPRASHARLTAHSTNGTEVSDSDMTEDSEHCGAGEALADTDGCSVGDCSFSVEDEECCSSVNGPVPGDTQNRKETLEEDSQNNEVCNTRDSSAGPLTESPTADQQEPLKVREKQNMEPANSYGVIGLSGTVQACQNQGSCGSLEVQTKPEPDYISSEDVIDGRQILIDHRVAMLSRSPLSQQKHWLGDSTVVLPSKYRCITDKHNNELIERAAPEDELDVDYDKDKERITTRQNRTNVTSEDRKTWLLNAPLDCRPRFRLVSFSMPPDPDTSLTSSLSGSQVTSLTSSLSGSQVTSLTSSLSGSQVTSPDDSYEDGMEGHIVPFLDDTTDAEQDLSEEHVYEEAGQDLKGDILLPLEKRSVVPGPPPLSGKLPHFSGPHPGVPALTSSPLLSMVRAQCYSGPHGLSHYPRSISVEGRGMSLRSCKEREGPSRERGGDSLFLSSAFGSSGSFSRCPPRPCSGLATPTSMLDIPPPFELACITKKPITKSSPSLLMDTDSFEKNKKKKSSIKRFLMLKFKKKSSDRKPVGELHSPTSKSSSESINRSLEMDQNHLSHFSHFTAGPSGSPRSSAQRLSSLASHSDGPPGRRSLAFLTRSVIRVESFEDRSGVPFVALPLTKPRSISFPNTSDYENVPPLSSDYENVQVPRLRPLGRDTFPQFFERPCRARSTANDTDGYVDMSSFPGFDRRTRAAPEETESAYTEAYKVCSTAVGPPSSPAGMGGAELDQGQTSEDEDRGRLRPADGGSRAFYIAKELMDTERRHVRALRLLQEDLREAVAAALGDDGELLLADDRLRDILNELPDVYALHRSILQELEHRIRHWEESQRIADVILSKKANFFVFTTFIGHYDRSVSLLEDSCRNSPAFAAVVSQFEQSGACEGVTLKHQLLQVIVRVAQYRMLLTDYLNNLRPDSKEYEDTQAAVAVMSDIADQASDNLKHGENMLRLVNIEYSVRGQRDLLQPGRVFIKEGTLMKVSRKSTQPRHLFLMNDVLLYTYPQQDGKYRLKNTLCLSGMKVTKPSSEDAQNALKIEVKDISITLSASSSSETEEWLHTLSLTIMEHARPAGGSVFLGEEEARPGCSLGLKPPTLVSASQVQMCMNCTCDFNLRLRRHHCHACGRIVCRSCSRNRHPLKYMKGCTAHVCDRCYRELHAAGTRVSAATAQSSPRPGRSSRPLSGVFQNIHPPNLWRHRKGTASFTQVAVCEEGGISGSLQRSKRSKHHWKRLWFLLKDKVLYTYRAKEEKVASESLPLLGFTVKLAESEQQDEANLFQLYHKKTLYYTFKAEDNCTAQRWVNAMEEATVL